MNLEFAGGFNRPDLVIKEFKVLGIIREKVVTLGSSIFIFKSGKPFLKDVSKEKWRSLVKFVNGLKK